MFERCIGIRLQRMKYAIFQSEMRNVFLLAEPRLTCQLRDKMSRILSKMCNPVVSLSVALPDNKTSIIISEI